MDFVRDGLNAEEKNVLAWADSRLFSNPAFLASKWGPDNWPSDVKTASVQAIPLLMLEIDIEKMPNGKHVVSWGVDSLDRVLDDLGIYEGVCVSCYGKDNYASIDEVRKNQYPIVNDQKHVHREMLKTFAYFAEADGEGILMRSFTENAADDFEMLYRRVLPVEQLFTDTSFAWQNKSFMSQIRPPDGTLETFPTAVYEVIGYPAGGCRALVWPHKQGPDSFHRGHKGVCQPVQGVFPDPIHAGARVHPCGWRSRQPLVHGAHGVSVPGHWPEGGAVLQSR